MKNRISDILENIENISEDDMFFLEKVKNEYPYFHLSHILFLKKLSKTEYIKYTNNLEKVALLSPNRKSLFKFLNGEWENSFCYKKEKEFLRKEENKETLKYGIRREYKKEKNDKEKIAEKEIKNEDLYIFNNQNESVDLEVIKKHKESKNKNLQDFTSQSKLDKNELDYEEDKQKTIENKKKYEDIEKENIFIFDNQLRLDNSEDTKIIGIEKVNDYFKENEEIEKEVNLLVEEDKLSETEIQINLDSNDILFLNELKEEISEVRYIIENLKDNYTVEEEKQIIRDLLMDYKPLFLVHSSYVTSLSEMDNKSINGGIIYSDDRTIENINSIIPLFKNEIDIIQKSIFYDLDDYTEYRKERVLTILKNIEKKEFVNNDKIISLIEESNFKDIEVEELEEILIKFIEYRDYLIVKMYNEENNVVLQGDKKEDLFSFIDYRKYYVDKILLPFREDSKFVVELDLIKDIDYVKNYLIYMMDKNLFLPFNYIDNESKIIKKVLNFSINNKDYYLIRKASSYIDIIKRSLKKIEDSIFSYEQNEINIVFKNGNITGLKYINDYSQSVKNVLAEILKNDLEIVDYVILEKFIKHNSKKYIKYIDGTPIKNIDIRSIEDDNHLYVNIRVLLDYYKEVLKYFVEDDQIIKCLDYNKLEIIKSISEKITLLSDISRKNILVYFIELSKINTSIDHINKEKLEKLDLKDLSVINSEIIDIIFSDSRYLKIAYIYYLKGKNRTNTLLKEGKNTISIELTKEDIKLIEKGNNVLLQKFSKNIEKIEESFKQRFKILGKNNEYKLFNDKNILEVKETKNAIIDRFIRSNITSIPKVKPEKKSVIEKDIIKEDIPNLATETLIKMYVKQKKYDLAIRGYKILLTQIPDRESYYRDKIKEIEMLISQGNEE